jgi:hypothetical protein
MEVKDKIASDIAKTVLANLCKYKRDPVARRINIEEADDVREAPAD